jgi:predicted TIM-barrel fold metal-dependent hydrolase
LNLGAFDPGFFERPAAGAWLRRLQGRGWLVQVYARSSQWPRIAPPLIANGTTIVIDHLGHPDVGKPIDQPGFEAVLSLCHSGNAYIKLAAPFRSSRTGWPHDDLAPFVRAAVAAFGIDRCVWGSDWPFLNAGCATTYGEQVAWLVRLVPDFADRVKILIDNPASLYGFASVRPATPIASNPA